MKLFYNQFHNKIFKSILSKNYTTSFIIYTDVKTEKSKRLRTYKKSESVASSVYSQSDSEGDDDGELEVEGNYRYIPYYSK